MKQPETISPFPLEGLAKLCAQRRGMKSYVLREMIKRDVPGNWANLSSWLHLDPKKRRTPQPQTLAGLLAIQKTLVR